MRAEFVNELRILEFAEQLQSFKQKFEKQQEFQAKVPEATNWNSEF